MLLSLSHGKIRSSVPLVSDAEFNGLHIVMQNVFVMHGVPVIKIMFKVIGPMCYLKGKLSNDVCFAALSFNTDMCIIPSTNISTTSTSLNRAVECWGME